MKHRISQPNNPPIDGWPLSSPEQQGLSSAVLAEGLRSLRENGSAIDSLLIIRNGFVVLDAYFAPYDGSFPHNLASITKSVTTTLVGIAAAQGKIALDRPMLSYFPRRAIANRDARKERITVRNLVSMRNGIESGCYSGDAATLNAMRAQPDWVQAALDRPMMCEPGSRFCYDSPGMHILSAILQECTGLSEAEFARQVLFEPLGIRDVIWEVDPQGHTRGWGRLHLYPKDAAKLGYLWLKGGEWDGRKVVPEDWVRNSVQPHSKDVGIELGYGYGWWVSPLDYYAMGRGGQYVRVIPDRDVVVVATGGNYDYAELESFLLPSLLNIQQARTANPAGAVQLETALTAAAEEPEPYPAAAVPDTVSQFTGRPYRCEPNPGSVESLRFEFGGGDTGTLYITQSGVKSAWPIGLDGHYRISGQGQAQRGYWESKNTFNLEIFDIGRLRRRFLFEDDRLEVQMPEASMTLTCRLLPH